MTKEEPEKENAELKKTLHEKLRAYTDSYLSMCNEKDNDFDKMKNKLESQIEKMKCCANCAELKEHLGNQCGSKNNQYCCEYWRLEDEE